jgi:hypothetical protein
MRYSLGSWLLLLAGAGCVSTPRPAVVTTSRAPVPPAQAIVFTADGIGGYGVTTRAFQRIAEQDQLPLHVEMVAWSHGYGRAFADHVGYGHARTQGQKLAAEIACYLRPQGEGPPLPVYLVAHSGGSAVVLAAAEFLPPNSVERIILMAPSISADYDVRPALRCARSGVDVFHSRLDWAYLGAGVAMLGTADRRWTAAAGRVGFRVPASPCPEDAALYTRLHQHSWDESIRWTGHTGGHFDCHNPTFLRAYVVPLLLPPGGQQG